MFRAGKIKWPLLFIADVEPGRPHAG
jgi:hypothetical protein